MATAPGTGMLSTNFWLIIVLPFEVRTYRSLKIKFLVKVKNKVYVTIGHVCDFERNWVLHQNDFKVKILWLVLWNFVLSKALMMNNIFTNNFMYFVGNSIVRIFLMQYFVYLWHFGVTLGHVCDIPGYKLCAHSCMGRKTSLFLFWKYFSSTN